MTLKKSYKKPHNSTLLLKIEGKSLATLPFATGLLHFSNEIETT